MGRLQVAEHWQELQNGYDLHKAQRVGEISPIANALHEWDKANNVFQSESLHSLKVDTLQSVAELQQLLRDASTDSELRNLAAEEIEETSSNLSTLFSTLQNTLIPSDPFATLPCLLEIRPGAGGAEAGIFVGDLLHMYQAYCKRQGLRAVLVKVDAVPSVKGSAEEVQEAILEIGNPGAYGILKSEAGVHRVQRVPATETQGRTHTSAASVLILPSFPEQGDEEYGAANMDNPSSDFYVNPQDVKTDVMRARGAGGQHVNTTDSAVRLTHIPTNTVVSIQDARSQHKNRQKAWRVLRSKLAQARRDAREEEKAQLRVSVVGVARMGRGDKIRTYNWGQQRVTDHRSGLTLNHLDNVLQGGESLDEIMDSVKAWQRERDVDALVADEEAQAARKKGK
ncbi:MAG: hypothetical protein Q9201_006652 [Fulgogasparrea decipioides]